MNGRAVIDPDEVATKLAIDQEARDPRLMVLRLARRGKLSRVTVGRCTKITAGSLRTFLEDQGADPADLPLLTLDEAAHRLGMERNDPASRVTVRGMIRRRELTGVKVSCWKMVTARSVADFVKGKR